MKEIYFALMILWAIDTVLTFINLNMFIKINPKKDWINLEINPINRLLYKKFGLTKGTFYSCFIISTLIYISMNFITESMFYIITGMYSMLILMHMDFYSKLNKFKSNWRTYAIISLLILSFIDLSFTFIYLSQYNAWQPDKAFNQMESNPMILFFINHLGLDLGMLISAIIIWLALYLIGKYADWYVIIPVILAILFAIVINSIHLTNLIELRRLYP